MIIPTRRTVAAAAVFALPLLFLAVAPDAVLPALAGDVFLFSLYLLESRRLGSARVTATPDEGVVSRIGEETAIRYTIRNPEARTLSLVVRQPLPEGWTSEEDDAVPLSVPPGRKVAVTFYARPSRRGAFVFPEPEITLRAGGWFALRRRSSPAARVLVYPALEKLGEVERMRRGRGMVLRGLRRHRQVGTGSEFERLRAYEPDDDFRHINWKTAARSGRPVTNVYQSERGRDVLLCMDCGRMMGQAAGGARILDMAVEAAMILNRAVVKEGDRPGMVAFRDRVENYLPVKGGKVGARRVADALAALDVSPVHTSFANLAAAIGARQNRRALIVIFTDFNDPQLAVDLADAMRLLRSRHAAIVVGIRDPILETVAATPVSGRAALCRQAAAGMLAEERDAASLEIRKLGVEVLECDSAGMATAVIDRYLSVKAGRFLD